MIGRRNRVTQVIVAAWLGIVLYAIFQPFNKDELFSLHITHLHELERHQEELAAMSCLLLNSERRCVWASPFSDNNTTDIWSFFLGIGPIFSGTMSLMHMLKHHPAIQVGNPQKHMELNYFEDENKLLLGMDYYKYMFGTRTQGIKIFGEWTPSYFAHPLVPYRVQAILGSKVKFLLTIDDPADAILRHYLRDIDEKTTSLTEYFESLLHDQETYDKCVEETIKSSFGTVDGPKTLNEVHRYYIPMDIYSLMLLEETVMTSCWKGKTTLLQHYFYKDNLDRWQAVFPNHILCIRKREFLTLNRINTILDFLGVGLLNEPLANFTIQNYEEIYEDRVVEKMNWYKKRYVYKMFRDYFIKRNRGLEKYCPKRRSHDIEDGSIKTYLNFFS